MLSSPPFFNGFVLIPINPDAPRNAAKEREAGIAELEKDLLDVHEMFQVRVLRRRWVSW